MPLDWDAPIDGLLDATEPALSLLADMDECPVVSMLDQTPPALSDLDPTSAPAEFLQVIAAPFMSSLGTSQSTIGRQMTLGVVAIVRVGICMDPTTPV